VAGVLFASQTTPTRPVAESIILAWSASEADEWRDVIAFLPF
jgi:hypothetical protein